LQGETLQQQVGFWRDHLAGAPALLELPTDRPRPPTQSYTGGSVPFALTPELSDALRSLSQQHGTTLFMTLLAGWAVTLGDLSRQDDIVVGTPVANRQHPELEKLLGFFVNTLALRVRLDGSQSVAALLAHVKANALAAYAHQDLPFEQVVEALQPARSLSHSPIFQVMLSMNNTPDAELSMPGLKLSSVSQAQTTNQFDLSLSLIDDGTLIEGALVYASDLFDTASAEAIGERYTDVLANFARNAQQTVADLVAALPVFLDGLLQSPGETSAAGTAPPATPHPYEAPSGKTETSIAQVWRDLLNHEQISRHDDFFELGGISLMAVQMISRLRPLLGVQVSLRDLFAHPKLLDFAKVFEGQSDHDGHPNLVPVRPRGDVPPLFLVHPVGGEVKYARDLAAALDARLPVYGLAAGGFRASETPLRSVQAMASAYIEAMREVQPKGPYRIAGWSAGGLIAYEIARQLLAAKQRVAFVGLIDASCPLPLAPSGEPLAAQPLQALDEIEYLRSWLPDPLPQPVAAQFEALVGAGDVVAMLSFCQANGLLPPGIPRDIELDLLRRHLAVALATQEAARHYQPMPVATDVTLITAAGERRADPTLGWGALLGHRLEVVSLDGSHMTIVEPPYVQSLGEVISTAVMPVELIGL
jgi:thioesterase domain-containing protein